MPTAAQFLVLADELIAMQEDIRAAFDTVDEAAAIGADGDVPVVGGRAADLLRRSLEDTARSRDRCLSCLDTVAGIATDRAARCREYTDEMAAYRERLIRWEAEMAAAPWMAASSWPVAPVRPGRWAEEG